MMVERASVHNLDTSQGCYKMKPNKMELGLDDHEESRKDMLQSVCTPKSENIGE